MLAKPLEDLPALSLNARQLQAFGGALGIVSLGDLLAHVPRRYEDRRRFESFPNQPMDRAICLRARIADVRTRRFSGRGFVEVTVENFDPGPFDAPLICRWFGMAWLSKMFAVDQELVLYGKPKWSGKRLVMDHPDFELLEPGEPADSPHLGRITPVYPLTSGLTQKVARGAIHRAMRLITEADAPSILPIDAAGPDLPATRWEALRQLHEPETLEEGERARRYFALEELAGLIREVLIRRRRRRERRRGGARMISGALWRSVQKRLPFSLTSCQERAIADIQADLASPVPMSRLLQGDVGSGKTVVAVAAMLLAVEAGWQAALMAPTQILAEQHYRSLLHWLEPLGIRLSLRTADRADDGFLPLFGGGGAPQIVIGTHALLSDGATFDKLGLIVIDEQHKFGVLQRERLAAKGETPDVLVMTATPIPRTLALTVHGDLDVSVLRNGPAGRGAIVTAIRPLSKTPEAAKFLGEQVAKGRQGYVVFPLLEESEKLPLASATKAADEWRALLPGVAVELVHGRMSAAEKDAVMERFRRGLTSVLVATTVVEVGVDAPNANVILIHYAERFGLAQLHQLRGRVGRGEHKSYCVLMCEGGLDEAREKLGILEETRDGFRIAEADLQRRGPGDLLGTEQSGLPDLRMPESLADLALVETARRLAEEMISAAPAEGQPAAP